MSKSEGGGQLPPFSYTTDYGLNYEENCPVIG